MSTVGWLSGSYCSRDIFSILCLLPGQTILFYSNAKTSPPTSINLAILNSLGNMSPREVIRRDQNNLNVELTDPTVRGNPSPALILLFYIMKENRERILY